MNIIWEHNPINSTELAKLAKDFLGWKKLLLILRLENYVKKVSSKIIMLQLVI